MKIQILLFLVAMIVSSVTELATSEDKTRSVTRGESAQADKGDDKFEIKRSSKAARAKGKITFDDLKFRIEKDAPFKDEMITDDIKELDNKDVNLSGWILPTTLFTQTGIKQFILVRDNQECCFGPGASLYDCVVVTMDGEGIDYVTRSVSVTGKLKIDTKSYRYPGGRGPRGATHRAIYTMKANSVK